MVTANASRFKDRNIMSDSYVDRYMRAKKRHAVTPKCLFGSPHRAETDQFLLQHDLEQMRETKEVCEKYDLSELPDGEEKDNIFPQSEASDETKLEKNAETSLQFQAKIVTDHDRPPSDNLFSPIEKAEASAAGSDIPTDYWQTSKRRRSSSNLESEHHETPEGEENDQRNVSNADPIPK